MRTPGAVDLRDRPRVGGGGPPPAIAGNGGGGGSEWVRLVVAPNDIEAHLLGGRMAEAGIETRHVKDRTAPGDWLYAGSNPWAPVQILVRRRQLDEARFVLAELAFEWTPEEGPS